MSVAEQNNSLPVGPSDMKTEPSSYNMLPAVRIGALDFIESVGIDRINARVRRLIEYNLYPAEIGKTQQREIPSYGYSVRKF